MLLKNQLLVFSSEILSAQILDHSNKTAITYRFPDQRPSAQISGKRFCFSISGLTGNQWQGSASPW
jgi:hypothetical protein